MPAEQQFTGSVNRALTGRIRVMQVVDSLDIGGLEKIAVQLANLLPADRFEAFLCTTRRDGPLQSELAPHVVHLRVKRKGRFDALAIRRMVSLIRENSIDIVHAHGSSLFVSRLASFIARTPVMIWHDHYGRCELGGRPAWLYRLATRGVAVIAVNHSLVNWSRNTLGVPSNKVWYVPNWVSLRQSSILPGIPGIAGRRIVCVANFRAQKDHLTLLRAMERVKIVMPDAHLLLLGARTEPQYADDIEQQIAVLRLNDVVTVLGSRQDVAAILQISDIGVLSSISEGLPLALLEYGSAGLPVVATDVGQCAEVLDGGRAGRLVPPSDPDRLAEELIGLLLSPARRAKLGYAIKSRIASDYNSSVIVRHIGAIYEGLLFREVTWAA